jgi:hypothetical protein
MYSANSSHPFFPLAAAALTAALCAPTAVADGPKGPGATTSTIIIKGDDPSSEARRIEIIAEDGDVEVIVDGKKLAADRLRIENGRIVILDEDGRELKSFGLTLDWDDDFGFRWIGPGEIDTIWGVQPAEHPKVMMGVQLGEPTDALRYHLRIEPGKCTMISGLYEGLPAHEAGLDRYDIIVAIEGNKPADPQSVKEALADKEPGDEVTFTVVHEGRKNDFTILLDAYDAARMDPSKLIGGSSFSSTIVIPEGDQFWTRDWRDLIFDPKTQQFWRQWGQRFDDQLRQRVPEDLDDRIDQLNQRLEEVQEMINRLVERARELAEEAEEQ